MSQDPYHDDDLKPTLRKSIFVFIDILGYSRMFEQSQQDGTEDELLQRLHDIITNQVTLLKDEVSLFESKKGFSFKNMDLASFKSEPSELLHLNAIKAFTDNIVIGWPFAGEAQDDGEFALLRAFEKLAGFQLDMLLEGFFTRGALSVNEAYMNNTFVFGAALHDAHKAETECARDPRIIFTSSAAEAIRKYHAYYRRQQDSPFIREVLKDSDGQWFLNYLDSLILDECEITPFEDKFRRHKAIVEGRLAEYKGNPKIWSKYAWVAGYHNFFYKQNRRRFKDKHKINIERFRGSPGLII